MAAQTFEKESSLGDKWPVGTEGPIGSWHHTNDKELGNQELGIQMKVFLFTTVYILSHLLRILLCKFNPVFLFLLQLASALSKYMQTLIHSHLIRAIGNILNCRNVQNIYLSIKETKT